MQTNLDGSEITKRRQRAQLLRERARTVDTQTEALTLLCRADEIERELLASLPAANKEQH